MGTKYRTCIGQADIKLTHHAKQRGSERLGINSENELRKIAANAKKKGIEITGIDETNYSQKGVDLHTAKVWSSAFRRESNVNRIYYYKGLYYVFCGNRARTLKTIIQMKNPVNVVRV